MIEFCPIFFQETPFYIMKNLLQCIGIFLLSICAQAQGDFEKGRISILPDSELIIAGSTNVNRFNCRFDIRLICKPQNFIYSEDKEYLRFEDLELHLLTKGFDCGNKRMNSDFQDLLKDKKYPEIVILVDRVELISEEFAKAYIEVSLAGKKNKYNLPIHLDENKFSGKFKIDIRDFGLKPPKKALGLIEVDETIEVQFNLKTAD